MSEKRVKFGSTVHVLVTENGMVDVKHAVLLRHGIDSTGKFSEVRLDDADGTILRVDRDRIGGYCACG